MSHDTRMRNDDLALCLWAHDVWSGISRKTLQIETLVKRTTNRKWTMASPMVTWPMTSRDPERSRSWPPYVWCPLFRKWLKIATWWEWSADRKWAPGIEGSRDRWRHWPWKIKVMTTICWCLLSQKRLEIATWWRWSAYRKWAPVNRMVTWPMTSRDLIGQGHDPNMFDAHYLQNGLR